MISIIIPAYNEEKYIEKTLKSIQNQDYENKEIIVVCNGCTDNTKKIAKKYAKKVFELKNPDLVEARNFGATKAEGKKLVFLDADTYFKEKGILKDIANTNAVIGTCKGSPDNKKFKFQLFWLAKNLLLKKGRISGITFCNKDIFNKVNGYETNSHPFENINLIKKFRKYGKFKVINKKVVTSTRRFEKFGFATLLLFWIKKSIKNDNKYPVVR